MTNSSPHANRSLILIRGLPGSGKSALALLLSEEGAYPVYSIDSYFTDESTGEYRFDYRENHLAYAQCESNTRNALRCGVTKVFVDNTFTLEWELEPYFLLAAEFGYRVFTVTVENRHGSRNIHAVTDEQIRKMASKYRVVLFPECPSGDSC
jgi:predicted kinase